MSILVVEDNLDMQNFIKTLLQDYYTVYTANNGKEALQYLKTNTKSIDLIVSDVMMPMIDGFALLDGLEMRTEDLSALHNF